MKRLLLRLAIAVLVLILIGAAIYVLSPGETGPPSGNLSGVEEVAAEANPEVPRVESGPASMEQPLTEDEQKRVEAAVGAFTQAAKVIEKQNASVIADSEFSSYHLLVLAISAPTIEQTGSLWSEKEKQLGALSDSLAARNVASKKLDALFTEFGMYPKPYRRVSFNTGNDDGISSCWQANYDTIAAAMPSSEGTLKVSGRSIGRKADGPGGWKARYGHLVQLVEAPGGERPRVSAVEDLSRPTAPKRP